MIYYVDAQAKTRGDGTKLHPFRKIQHAADIALPGDEILVFPGVYREAVHPVYGGKPDARIVYRSIEPGKAVITGSEP